MGRVISTFLSRFGDCQDPRLARERGIALIELVLLLPIFGIILSGMITLGDAFEQRKLLLEGMRHGGRGAAATLYRNATGNIVATCAAPAITGGGNGETCNQILAAAPPTNPQRLAIYLTCGYLAASGEFDTNGWLFEGGVRQSPPEDTLQRKLVTVRAWKSGAVQGRPFTWSSILNRTLGNRVKANAIEANFVLERCS